MSEWISVEDRLPIGEDHLLYLNDGVELPGCVVGYWGRLTASWMVNSEREYGLPVTHWMPLPSPPDTKEQK